MAKFKQQVSNFKVIAGNLKEQSASSNCLPVEYDPNKDYFELSEDMVMKTPVSFLDPSWISKKKEAEML